MRPVLPPLLVVILAAGASGSAADWPQFRGPRGDGTSEAAGLPLAWSEAENVRWRVPVPGRGRSSPVVLGDRIWLTTAEESLPPPELVAVRLRDHPDPGAVYVASRVTVRLLCLDRATGKLRYDKELLRLIRPEPVHRLSSYATPTPVAEPGRVYCDFGAWGTFGLEADTGRVLWECQLPADHLIGPASSPALFRDLLLLVRDGADVQYVAAVNKNTGRLAWKTGRPPIDAATGNEKKAYSTPLVIEAAGRWQAIVPGAQWVCSYDPATGEELWRVRHGRNYSVAPRPVFAHGMVYLSTGCPAPELWAIRVDGQGDVSGTHVAWRAKGSIPSMSSPLAVGGAIYCVSDNGIASCFDARTGQRLWRRRLGEEHVASPIFAEGRVYCFSRAGKTTVLQAGPQFVQLAENQLEGAVIATPAVAAGAIFLRTDARLYCIGKRP